MELLPSWGAYGITWIGGFSGNDHPAFPITGHASSLWGGFKWTPQNGDTTEIHTVLYDQGVDISIGSFKTADATTTWTAFACPSAPTPRRTARAS